MSEWDEVQVGDLCHIKHGYAFKGEHFEDEGHSLLLTPGNFLAGGGLQIRDGKETFYSGEFPDEYLLEEGDLVVAMTDLKQNAPILGSTLRIPESGRFLHNQRLGLVQDVANSTDRDFLYYLLNDQSVRWWLRATATGSTVRHTAPERIYQAKVRLPPKSIQQTIGVSLRAFDDLIENNRRRIEILEEMARLLYREWFVHFRFTGHEDVELVDSDLGPIPEGWEWKNLFELAEVGFGFSFKSKRFAESGAIRVVRIRDVPRNTTSTYTDEDPGDRYEIHDGDVLIGMDGDFHMCRWADGLAHLNQRVARLRSKSQVSQLHLHLALEPPIHRFNQTIIGTTVAHLGKRHLEEIFIAEPSPPVFAAVTERLQAMHELDLNLRKQNRLLREARDLLLPRLVSGELDVSELDLGLERVGA